MLVVLHLYSSWEEVYHFHLDTKRLALCLSYKDRKKKIVSLEG